MQLATYKKPLSIAGALLIILAVFFIAKEAKAPESLPLKAGDTIPVVDPASIGKVIKDKDSGKEFMSNQIIVEFNPAVSEADALTIIGNHGGKMNQRFTLVSMFLVNVNDPGDGSVARRVATEFRALPEVKSADLNYLTTLPANSN